MEDHFKNAAKNATYRSKTIQGEIIRITGTLVRAKLVDEIKDAVFFSIMADEASDISVKEQLSLVLRFVDGEGKIREEFIGFIHCNEGTSGQAIADNIFHKLDELGIDIMNCRGQGYDGAGNMTRKNKGVVRDRNPKALGCHCQAHILNLCIARACKITSVMMNKIRCMQELFDYPKRMELLLKLTDESDIPNVEKKKLKDCCRTRWVQRVDSFEIFLQMFKVVCRALNHISENVDTHWNADSIILASCYFMGVHNFGFLINLIVVCEVMMYARALTIRLQSRKNDIAKSFVHVKTVEQTLQKVRDSVDKYHAKCFQKAVGIASNSNISVEGKRSMAIKKTDDIKDLDEISHEYRVHVTIPFIDCVLEGAKDRFSVRHQSLYNGFNILPCVVINIKTWRNDLKLFNNQYYDDIDAAVSLEAEFDMWEVFWRRQVELPSNKSEEFEYELYSVKSVLKITDKEMFPAIWSCLKLLATFPVTTCECERSISVMRRLTNYLRSTMSQERFSFLALLHIHRDFPYDINEIVTKFAESKPRKMRLSNILNSDNQ